MDQATERPSLVTRRRAGVLLHPTSLPGPHGMGDLGAGARRFVDWLAAAGGRLWQVLPLGPTGNNCPYVCWSAFAGNPLLVDLAGLADQGLLDPADLQAPSVPAGPFIDYDAVRAWKEPRLAKAAARLCASPEHPLAAPFRAFRDHESWAHDAALFAVAKRRHGGKAYWEWERPLCDRDRDALAALEQEAASEIAEVLATLFFFEHQWQELRAYGRARGVEVVGDLPIYVDRDSVDVWAHPGLFFLDDEGTPTAVSGVPPDYFSELGQLWGNPLYRWQKMAENDYLWWRGRLARVLAQADHVRIDHFRGLAAYWEVPAGAPDARTGKWVDGPGLAFFRALERHMGKLPLIAEDLGIIDDAVIALREAAGLPGMRVLQFGFGGGADNPHLPHNHTKDGVAYPGTHDNDTAVGWWRAADATVKRHVQRYLRASGHEPHWDLIHACYASVAATAMIPMQDVLGLGSEARMNNPATRDANWRFRLEGDPFRADHARRLRDLAELYGRI
ncbi:MAG: 4-alpha-glucanotransferase [Polyangiaceae bacterium]|nr:4-alpha-glucanotransferase [Polyangiaceae bacterium]